MVNQQDYFTAPAHIVVTNEDWLYGYRTRSRVVAWLMAWCKSWRHNDVKIYDLPISPAGTSFWAHWLNGRKVL